MGNFTSFTSPGLIFNILRAADAQCRANVRVRVFLLAMRTIKVERIFVGENEQRLLAPKNDWAHLRYKVGEIDPLS